MAKRVKKDTEFPFEDFEWRLRKYAVINKRSGMVVLGDFRKYILSQMNLPADRWRHAPAKIDKAVDRSSDLLSWDGETVQYHGPTIDKASELPDEFWIKWCRTRKMPDVQKYRELAFDNKRKQVIDKAAKRDTRNYKYAYEELAKDFRALVKKHGL